MGVPYDVHLAEVEIGKISWREHRPMGRHYDATCCTENVRAVFRTTITPRSVRHCKANFIPTNGLGSLGMLESCVAPILILIISMFYTKREQVNIPLPRHYSFH